MKRGSGGGGETGESQASSKRSDTASESPLPRSGHNKWRIISVFFLIFTLPEESETLGHILKKG